MLHLLISTKDIKARILKLYHMNMIHVPLDMPVCTTQYMYESNMILSCNYLTQRYIIELNFAISLQSQTVSSENQNSNHSSVASFGVQYLATGLQ